MVSLSHYVYGGDIPLSGQRFWLAREPFPGHEVPLQLPRCRVVFGLQCSAICMNKGKAVSRLQSPISPSPTLTNGFCFCGNICLTTPRSRLTTQAAVRDWSAVVRDHRRLSAGGRQTTASTWPALHAGDARSCRQWQYWYRRTVDHSFDSDQVQRRFPVSLDAACTSPRQHVQTKQASY